MTLFSHTQNYTGLYPLTPKPRTYYVENLASRDFHESEILHAILIRRIHSNGATTRAVELICIPRERRYVIYLRIRAVAHLTASNELLKLTDQNSLRDL